MIKFLSKILSKVLAFCQRPEYAYNISILMSLLLSLGPFLIYNACVRGHPERYKVTQGTILGVSQSHVAKTLIIHNILRVRYAYNNKYIEATTSDSDFIDEIVRNISKFRRKRVLIAFDTLNTEHVRIILTDKQYKKYGLVQPDSLKWFNYAERHLNW